MAPESNSVLRCLLCERFAHVRGLCRVHYQRSQEAVQRGETTWERLIEDGHAKPVSGGWKARMGKFLTGR